MTFMYDQLKLAHQLCFPLYRLSREVTQRYRPLLEAIDLTYPQYLVMMVLWEHKILSVNEIGRYLSLDTGTLTPLLKRLAHKQLILRTRAQDDERRVDIQLTARGRALQHQAKDIPLQIANCMPFTAEEIAQLQHMLQRLSS